MTKSEFDERFFTREASVHHSSMEEWNTITQYATRLGAQKQPRTVSHNCLMFPYTFIGQDGYVNAKSVPVGCSISFDEFASIISNDDELPQVSLIDIL